jgi:hypothetical protein
MVKNETLGYLGMCMDRRFVEATRQAFQEKTGLGDTDFWQESWPGGAAVAHDQLGENYAYHHGARILGWQAHGDRCGGQPGISNEEIQQRLDAVIAQKAEKFPVATHFRIFVTEGVVSIREITSGGK